MGSSLEDSPTTLVSSKLDFTAIFQREHGERGRRMREGRIQSVKAGLDILGCSEVGCVVGQILEKHRVLCRRSIRYAGLL